MNVMNLRGKIGKLVGGQKKKPDPKKVSELFGAIERTDEAMDDPDVATYLLTGPERDIIIAALRLWQFTDIVSSDHANIAINGRSRMLDDDEIDTLIEEKLNC